MVGFFPAVFMNGTTDGVELVEIKRSPLGALLFEQEVLSVEQGFLVDGIVFLFKAQGLFFGVFRDSFGELPLHIIAGDLEHPSFKAKKLGDGHADHENDKEGQEADAPYGYSTLFIHPAPRHIST
jgi:hypothetical protein